MKIIVYSKPGCHLCEGLEEKLRSITEIELEIEIRDINTNNQWWQMYQYEIPVLFLATKEGEKLIPRPSPRISVVQLSKILQKLSQ
ncbi:glutaredoxin family protein [Geminocystis sp. GBBB08]|uniref:glutaredoxin family protein n=1 Tax=Geminocystis sp. GBBB08 TaxID=2604140 RepID=UPI0027E24BE7|nr:glutaredoxin family protein [Geminocystis sp. GBBB08]MBL1208870.1 glutaredoxin family protein [Geminocystis sp. GBBB08]